MRSSNPTVLLFCFAPAGSSSSVFREWQQSFPDNVQIRPVELPGHGKRMGVPLMQDYRSLVLAMTREIAQDIANAQRHAGHVHYAGFGHGVGAAFNFAVCSRLAERLRQAPMHCFLSSGLPLHIERRKLSAMSDAELALEMSAQTCTPLDVLTQSGMLHHFLQIFRADCAMHEESVLDRRRSLDCPLTLFAAERDGLVAPEIMWSWNRHSTRITHNIILPGDHVSALQAPQEVIGHICNTIEFAHLQRSILTA